MHDVDLNRTDDVSVHVRLEPLFDGADRARIAQLDASRSDGALFHQPDQLVGFVNLQIAVRSNLNLSAFRLRNRVELDRTTELSVSE